MCKKRAKAGGWIGLVALLLSAQAGAASELFIERLQAEGLRLEQLLLRVEHAEERPQVELRLATLVAPGIELREVSWRCTLRRVNALPQCHGPLSWKGGPRGSLRLRQDRDWEARWSSGERRVDLSADAALQAVHLAWRQLPLEWLQAALPEALPEGLVLTGGRLSGSARGDTAGADWQADLRLEDAALDSQDGLTAAAGVHATAALRWREGDTARLSAEVDLQGGEVLAQQLYVPLAAGTRLQLALRREAGGWALEQPLRLEDPEQASFELRWGGADPQAWSLSARMPDLGRSGPRYLDGPLAALGFAGAAFAGGLEIELAGSGERLRQLALQAERLTFADPKGVIVLSGLQGGWRWQAEGETEATEIGWQALSLQGIALGPAVLRGRSLDGRFEASQALAFAPFGGSMSLFPLRFQPFEGSAEFDAEMADIGLAALSAQLGWPGFEGSLSGRLPAARYRDEVFSSEGSLSIDVFDGRISVSGLHWERPFGISPSLSADVELGDLDLEPLTGAFGFGAISGRLKGHIRGLRMLDGSPVAFDAFLHTDDAWQGRRRISQKAVNDIGSVGGGVAVGLQQRVLSLFDTFGYKRIGLRCRLANHVCEMGGIEDLANGYVLIEGAGLPRVTVNGYRRRVDWPVLVARLQAAASGGGISVD